MGPSSERRNGRTAIGVLERYFYLDFASISTDLHPGLRNLRCTLPAHGQLEFRNGNSLSSLFGQRKLVNSLISMVLTSR
jgi:hypothetical protein